MVHATAAAVCVKGKRVSAVLAPVRGPSEVSRNPFTSSTPSTPPLQRPRHGDEEDLVVGELHGEGPAAARAEG
eukprot:COSAG04_NODE_763_length_10502_cov_4.002788_11_plen_72_part_01